MIGALAVAGLVAAGGSAFTGASDVTAAGASGVAGMSTTTVSGAVVTGSSYALTTGDPTTIDSITSTVSPLAAASEVRLKVTGGTAPMANDMDCADALSGATSLVCTFGSPQAIDFTGVDLVVAS